MVTKGELVAHAKAALAAYPQYVGYHDGDEWVLVRVGKRIRTKMGLAFEAGEIALAKVAPAEPEYGMAEGWTAWSRSNGVHTWLPKSAVTKVETEPIEVGRFTLDPTTGVVTGPAEYMREQGLDRIARIEAGADVVFNMGLTHSPSPEVALLVSLQTDYAGWRGVRSLPEWCRA